MLRPCTAMASWYSPCPFDRTWPLLPVQVIPVWPPLEPLPEPDPEAPDPLPGAVAPPPAPQPARIALSAMAERM